LTPRGVSKIKMGTPNMENQTRKHSKLPDCIKRMLKAARKIQCQGPGKKNRLMPKRNMINGTTPMEPKINYKHEQTSI